MYSFLLSDGHGIVRSGMRTLIKENFPARFIHETNNGGELMALVEKETYNLILMDIDIPDADVGSIMPWLATASPGSSIIIFTTYPESLYGARCMEMGASSFLPKTAESAEIVHAIQLALEKRKYISPTLASLLLEQNQRKGATPFDFLSRREMEISVMLDKGMSVTEICRRLGIQYSTANTYKRRIFEKLNVDNVRSLYRLMRSYGMVS